MSEEKAKLVEVKDGKLILEKEFTLDPNKDGEPVARIALRFELDIAEIPDEAIDAFRKSKEK